MKIKNRFEQIKLKSLVTPLFLVLSVALMIFGCGGPVQEEKSAEVSVNSTEKATSAPDNPGRDEVGDGTGSGNESAMQGAALMTFDASPLVISNGKLAGQLITAVSLDPNTPRKATREQKAAFLKTMQENLVIQAAEIFPDPVEMTSGLVVKAMLSEPLVINEPTTETAQIAVRLWLYNCDYKLVASRLIVPVTPENEQLLVQNVNDIWDGIEPYVYQMRGELDRTYIKKALDNTRKDYLSRITNPATTQLKRPLSDEDVTMIIDRMAKNAEGYGAHEGGASLGPIGFSLRASDMNEAMKLMFAKQLVLSSGMILCEMTSTNELDDFKMSNLHPDYNDLYKKRNVLRDEYQQEKRRIRKGTSTEKIEL